MKHRMLVVITLIFALTNTILSQGTDDVLVPTPLAVTEINPIPPNIVDWHPSTDTLALLVGTNIGTSRDNVSERIALWRPINGTEFPQISSMFSQNLSDVSRTIFAYSPDGTKLATLSLDRLSIIDTATGRILAQREGTSIGFVEWSPNSTRLAIMSLVDFYALDIVDADSGNTQTYRFFSNAITFAGASITGATWGSENELAVISNGRHRAILNLQSNTMIAIDDCCSERAYELKWQPEGRLLATHDRVYDIDTRQAVFYFPRQNRVFWSPNGQWLLGITLDEVVLISVVEQQVVLRFSVELFGQDHAVKDADWSGDGRYIALVTDAFNVSSADVTDCAFASVWDITAIAEQAGVTLNN